MTDRTDVRSGWIGAFVQYRAGLLACFLTALALNTWNVGFALGLHADEPLKVHFIRSHTQDFHHPVLMLQLVRGARWFADLATDQEIAVAGRIIIGFWGAIAAVLTCQLARRLMAPGWALTAGIAVAVSPIAVVHAHYLDERVLLMGTLLVALVAFLRFLEHPTRGTTLLAGMCTGLALSSHYLAILLVPLFATTPFVCRNVPAREFFQGFVRVLTVAGLVFVVINWSLFANWRAFVQGVGEAAYHAASGHDVRIAWYHYALGFHLLFSLGPGMTWPLTVVGTVGLASAAANWRRAADSERIVTLAALTFYLAVEIPALKPWPDYAGYALPVVPLLAILATHAFSRLLAPILQPRRITMARVAAAGVMVAYPCYESVRFCAEMVRDTRFEAEAWLRDHPAGVLVGAYAAVTSTSKLPSIEDVDVTELRRLGVDYVLASSFMYERYAFGSRLSGQDASVYRAHERYEALFTHPYIELAPRYRSTAFSNPTIRVVDLRAPVGY